MRIRKHAKISPLSNATAPDGTVLVPHGCQLNQSPWDVINFSPPSTPQPARPPSQVDRNGVSAGNGSSVNLHLHIERQMNAWLQPPYPTYPGRRITTTAAASGSTSSSAAAAVKVDKMEVDPPPPRLPPLPPPAPLVAVAEKKKQIVFCCKTDGKNWQCKNEASRGNSMCEHHLSQVKSYSNPTKKSGKPAAEAPPPPPPPPSRRARPKKSSASSSANPYEFYYYSGFGPRWGKKRGEINKDGGRNIMPENARNEQEMMAAVGEEDSDEVEYEEEDEEENNNNNNTNNINNNNNNNGRKRVRKPIKARSLKSLM
ncbi:hypothetical protein ABFS83_04G044100 [Erythranthe nasuta]